MSRPTSELFVEASAARPVGAGFLEELYPIQDEVLQYHGQSDPSTYLKLLSDDQVLATFRQRRSGIIARETIVEPGGPSDLDRAAADHLREQLKRLRWDRSTSRMLVSIICGYSVSELMYDVDPFGRVIISDIRARRAGRFRFGRDGHLYQVDPQKVRMPDRKFWTSTWGAEDDDDPHGRGLGHVLYWLVWFKRNAFKFWAQFLENFATPTPLLKVPVGTTEEARRKLAADARAFGVGGALVIPKNVEAELSTAARDSGGDYDKFVARVDSAISKVVLLQTMTTDDGASLAQGQVHERVSEAGAKADSDVLTESFAQGPARWLTEWNFPGAAPPIVYRDFRSKTDAAAAAETDAKLATIGYRPTADRVREVYGEGYEPVAQVSAAGPGPAAFAEAPAIADAAGALAEGWREVLGPEVEALEELLGDARSLSEVRDRLGELARRDPKGLADSLSRSMFAGAVAGQAGAEEIE